jgi:thiamine pyrophosphokinase
MDGKTFIFLNGHYPRGDRQFIRNLIRRTRPRPRIIAVDGGIAFLQQNTIKPNFWISDMDSAPRIGKDFLDGVEFLLYPPDKGKTDAELALDLCARENLCDITIFGWETRGGEIDHLLGNLFLCRNLMGRKRAIRLRYLNNRREIIALRNETRVLRGYKDRLLSIIPLSSKIILTLKGTRFPADELLVRAGATVSMRNQITANRLFISITGAGLAIIL